MTELKWIFTMPTLKNIQGLHKDPHTMYECWKPLESYSLKIIQNACHNFQKTEHVHFLTLIRFVCDKSTLNVYILMTLERKQIVTGIKVQPFLDGLNATESPG